MSLIIDFYESGCGETTILTFPDGGIGIIDAHPSPDPSRPDILNITKDKKIHFICLTHPHQDHALDLANLVEQQGENIDCFWNSITEEKIFIESLRDIPAAIDSPQIDNIKKYHEKNSKCMIRLLGEAKKSGLRRECVYENIEKKSIGDVEIYFLSPSHDILTKHSESLDQFVSTDLNTIPDVNELSIVLGIKYGKSLFVQSGDALLSNWQGVLRKHKNEKLPKASVFKIPHHGAQNALFKNNRDVTCSKKCYLNICYHGTHSVIFGNHSHPDKKVLSKIHKNSNAYCLNRSNKLFNSNPMNINNGVLKGGYKTCNSKISITCELDGNITINHGNPCASCPDIADCIS